MFLDGKCLYTLFNHTYLIFIKSLHFSSFVLGDYVDNYENPYFYMWILCSVISSIYTYTWDVKMDWGLFSKNSGEYTFLREEIVYDNTASFLYYYLLIMCYDYYNVRIKRTPH